MKKSIPFVIFENNGYSINPEAEYFFKSLDKTTIFPISVVGKYRTGKSYLINRVILQQQQVNSHNSKLTI
jgi:hypothetical protein